MDILPEYAAILRRVVLIVITVYILISGLLYFFQDNLIFFRQNITDSRIALIKSKYRETEEVFIQTRDGTELHGWLVHGINEKPAPLIIYFGGNAEEVSWMIEEVQQFGKWSALLVNYRGYGKSGGTPGEKALLDDALLLYDTFTGREDIDETKVAVMGRSLGTAMAVHVSANRKIKRTVLVSPFRSIKDLAKSNFPFIPVGLLLKHEFNVLPESSVAGNPMLTMIASEDNIVPKKHSMKVFEAWGGEKSLQVIDYADHNTISLYPLFWNSIRRFLNDQP